VAATDQIDAVYLWVDGSDPAHQALLARYGPAATQPSGTADARRFRDNGELRSSLRSLERFAPWIRHVYLVTNGQVPPWLNVPHPRLSLITHEKIFPDRRDLPTFNSNAIDLHIHRLPGLAARYLLFNDDLFLGAPTTPDDFVTADGTYLVSVESRRVATDVSTGDAFRRACARTAELLGKRFPDAGQPRVIAHVPQIYDSDVAREAQQEWPEAVKATSAHRLRDPTDLAWQLAYFGFALNHPTSRDRFRERVLTNGSTEYVLMQLKNDPAAMNAHFSRLASLRPRFFCINDDLDESPEAAEVRTDFATFLETFFPGPSSFEQRETVPLR